MLRRHCKGKRHHTCKYCQTTGKQLEHPGNSLIGLGWLGPPVGLPRVGRSAGFRDGSSISRGVGGLQGWHKLGLYHYEPLGFQDTCLARVCSAVLLLLIRGQITVGRSTPYKRLLPLSWQTFILLQKKEVRSF